MCVCIDRLCPSFRGHHHEEEITYYKTINHSQLLTLLDTYTRVLLTVAHEDATIAGDGA